MGSILTTYNNKRDTGLKGVSYLDNQTLQIPVDIRTYLENLIEDAGMQLTPQLQQAMIADLYARLEKKLIADAVENMKPEDVEAFTQLVQSGTTAEEIQKYINEHVPNAKEVFVQSLVDFRTYFLGGAMQASSVAPNTGQPNLIKT